MGGDGEMSELSEPAECPNCGTETTEADAGGLGVKAVCQNHSCPVPKFHVDGTGPSKAPGGKDDC